MINIRLNKLSLALASLLSLSSTVAVSSEVQTERVESPSCFGMGFSGTEGPDTIFVNGGTLGASTPCDDQVFSGLGGNDIFYMGDGNDWVHGEEDNDEIGGGKGNDKLYGDAGNDLIYGGPDNDLVGGGPGDDTLFGGAGDDFVDGGAGNDYVNGGSGNDTLYGRVGSEPLLVNRLLQSDTLSGGAGHDRLILNNNSNVYAEGGEGNDTYIINVIGSSKALGNMEILDSLGSNRYVFTNASSLDFQVSYKGETVHFSQGEQGLFKLKITDANVMQFQFSDGNYSLEALLSQDTQSW